MSKLSVKIHLWASLLFCLGTAAFGCGTSAVLIQEDPIGAGGGSASSTGAGGEGGAGCPGLSVIARLEGARVTKIEGCRLGAGGGRLTRCVPLVA